MNESINVLGNEGKVEKGEGGKKNNAMEWEKIKKGESGNEKIERKDIGVVELISD